MIALRVCLAAPFPVACVLVTLLIAVTKYQGWGWVGNMGGKVSSGCELRKYSPLLWGKHGSSHVRQLSLSHTVREQMPRSGVRLESLKGQPQETYFSS